MLGQTIEPIELEGAPALGRAGRLFVLFALVWALVGQLLVVVALQAVGFPGDKAAIPARAAAFLAYLVVSFGPLAIAWFPRGAARLLLFRWLLHATQPGARFDAGGVELCTPEDGCNRFNWDEIGSLEPDAAWLAATSGGGWPTTLDLMSVEGRVLMRVPPSVYEELHPIGSRWHSGPRTLAERIVVLRPDRFTFADTNQNPPHYWFRLAQPTPRDPPGIPRND